MSQLIVYNSNTDFSVTSNVLDADINEPNYAYHLLQSTSARR